MTTDRYPRVEINDEKIDEFGRYFLCATVRKLDEVLAISNISADERRRICGLFTDSFALFLDNGWLDNGQEKLWPLLAFAEREGASSFPTDSLATTQAVRKAPSHFTSTMTQKLRNGFASNQVCEVNN